MVSKQLIKLVVVLLCISQGGKHIIAQSKYNVINSGELISKGVALHDDKKYDEALKLYNQVSENDTNYMLAVVEKAFTYYAMKEYDKSIKLCEEALTYGTKYDNNLYLTLASAYDDAGKSDKAIEVYDRAIKVFPKNHLLIFNKAITLEKQEKYAEALELYKQVLMITPYHAMTHYRLGRMAEQEGDLVRAMLCFNTFIMVEPATDRALSVLQELDNMVSKKYDDSKAKGIKLSENGEDFSEIEPLIRKQLALNKNYKIESKADFSVIRQDQALLSNLAAHTAKNGFWEKFYVPFYTRVYKEGHFEEFSYFLLASSDNQKIQSLLQKNKSGITKFNTWKNDAFAEATTKRKVEIDSKSTDMLQLYYDGGSLYGEGPYIAGTDKKTGKWDYYFTSGRLMSEGTYDHNGEQTGDWKFYYSNGILKKEIKLSAGKENGPYKSYQTNGNLKEAGSFAAGELTGEIKTYTWYGGLDAIHHFNKGQHEGKYEEYYANGKLKFNSFYTNNKLTGIYKFYHPDGNIDVDGNIKDNLKDGAFAVYFRNGKIELKKNYLLDKENGSFTKFYNNGKLSQEGAYKNLKPTGTWKSYFMNGQLDEITTYNDAGNENGVQQYFDVDGKQYYEAEYKDGHVLQYKYMDKNGKVVADTKLKPKQEVKAYYSDGYLRWTGSLEKGKRAGLWKEYARNGLVVGEYNYSDGSLNGTAKAYYYNGKVHKDMGYKDGNLQGEYLEYYRNGKLYKSAWYENGVGQGDVTIYYKSGEKERFYTLLDDNLNGKSYTYDVEGKLNVVEKYEKGTFAGIIFYDTTGREIRNIAVDKEKVEVDIPSVTNEVVLKRTFVNGSKEGLSNTYYLDNKLSAGGSYLNDKREGVWKWYNPDNSLNFMRTYESGELQGHCESYDLFGKIRSTYECFDNNIFGIRTNFYYNGNKKEEVSFWDDDENGPTQYFGFNGEHVMTLWFEHGALTKVIYVNGKGGKPDTVAANPNGTIEAKYANGKTAFILEYKNGYQNGKYREFFEDGTPCRESQYVDDLLEGERKTWYRNGKLRSVETFKNDDLDGVTTLYNDNGTKKADISFKYDDLHGPVKYYNTTGKLSASYVFYDGDMIKKVL